MPIPFGVGVGDFIAVGKLIGKIAVELRMNGEASPAYQALLFELEALDKALRQLQDLQPSKHELLQLNSIRATALSCTKPLQDFLDKISKFEPTMGTFGVKTNRFKGFPRRMQWRLMYKDDITELRSVLGSHVATINLLLMTQTVRSITLAENDRAEVACELEKKIMAHRVLLEDVKDKLEKSTKQHSETNTKLADQRGSLQNLETKADSLSKQVQDQNATLDEMQSLTSTVEKTTASVLTTTTDILSMVTSGVLTLQAIVGHLLRTFELCSKFTAEMRAAMGELLQRFWVLQATLHRIEASIPLQIHLPVVQFTNAFGDTMALPYQLCQKWSTFKELMRVMYIDRQGWFRIDMGQYLIMNSRGGRLIKRKEWQDMVKEGDHLSMCIALNDLRAREGHCPFPSCEASLDSVEATNGGKICPECGRWTLSTPRPSKLKPGQHPSSLLEYEYVDQDQAREDLNNQVSTENIDAYRRIYVQTIAESMLGPAFPDTIRQPDFRPISVAEVVLEDLRRTTPNAHPPMRQGTKPLKDAKKEGIPPNAKWTKISRKLVNREALEAGKERYEARDDFVIVLRVLSREEVQRYAEITQRIRVAREVAVEDGEAGDQSEMRRHETKHTEQKRRNSDSWGGGRLSP